VIGADSSRLGDHRAWVEQQLADLGGDLAAFWTRHRDSGIVFSEWRGAAVFAFAPTSPGVADFVQLSFGREIEVLAGPIVDPGYRPWSADDLFESSWVKREPETDAPALAGPVYRLQPRGGLVYMRSFLAARQRLKREQREAQRPQVEARVIRDVGLDRVKETPFLKLKPDWFDFLPREKRFLADWERSSAAADRVFAHWAFDIQDFEERGRRQLGLIPRPLKVPADRLLAEEGDSVHRLMERIEAVDAKVGLPFACFFLMTHGHWVIWTSATRSGAACAPGACACPIAIRRCCSTGPTTAIYSEPRPWIICPRRNPRPMQSCAAPRRSTPWTSCCPSSAANSWPSFCPTTMPKRCAIWRKKASATIRSGRWPPTSPTSKPGASPRRAKKCPWPAPEALLLKFVAYHLWDPAKREIDPGHGMPNDVAAELKAAHLLRVDGPHAPNTVRRRLASWSKLTQWRGLKGKFNAPGLRSALKLAVRASPRPRGRKSRKAVTADILAVVLKACAGDRLVDVRDRALLLTAFASGGRRRSEVSSLRLENILAQDPVPADQKNPDGDTLPCAKIRLGRTKTTAADEDAFVLLVGRPVLALQEWLERARISEGAVFRGIDRWGHLERKALTPQAVNLILKRRVAEAGLDPKAFSAHGLRAGFLTETARRGIPLSDATIAAPLRPTGFPLLQ
jgi:site-specific recombinase XerC